MDKSKYRDQDVEEDVHAKEKLASAFIDQPNIELLPKRPWSLAPRRCLGDRPLQALQSPPFSLVALQECAATFAVQVGMLIVGSVGRPAV